MRGHAVEDFVVHSLLPKLCEEESHWSVSEGSFLQNGRLSVCGNPDALLLANRDSVLLEIKSTSKDIDRSLLLKVSLFLFLIFLKFFSPKKILIVVVSIANLFAFAQPSNSIECCVWLVDREAFSTNVACATALACVWCCARLKVW